MFYEHLSHSTTPRYLNVRLLFRVRVMSVFNATFNNISVISWWSVLLVEETGVFGQKPPICRRSLTNFITFIMLYHVQFAQVGFELTTLVVIGTVCICSYKSNYHTIATTRIDYDLN